MDENNKKSGLKGILAAFFKKIAEAAERLGDRLVYMRMPRRDKEAINREIMEKMEGIKKQDGIKAPEITPVIDINKSPEEILEDTAIKCAESMEDIRLKTSAGILEFCATYDKKRHMAYVTVGHGVPESMKKGKQAYRMDIIGGYYVKVQKHLFKDNSYNILKDEKYRDTARIRALIKGEGFKFLDGEVEKDIIIRNKNVIGLGTKDAGKLEVRAEDIPQEELNEAIYKDDMDTVDKIVDKYYGREVDDEWEASHKGLLEEIEEAKEEAAIKNTDQEIPEEMEI